MPAPEINFQNETVNFSSIKGKEKEHFIQMLIGKQMKVEMDEVSKFNDFLVTD